MKSSSAVAVKAPQNPRVGPGPTGTQPMGTGQNQPDQTITTPVETVNSEVHMTQTTQFIDDDKGEILNFKDAGVKGIYTPITPNIDLARFLQRPVHIITSNWTTSWVNQVHNPWGLFLNNTAIANKLQNFAYIRGKLKIKVVINSSPFFYGAMRVAYEPLSGYNSLRTQTFAGGGSVLIPYSQHPGFFLYPQTSTGGEMELPFFYHQDYLPLSAISNANNMGVLRLWEFVPLKSANGVATTGVTISVYAWMEDVQLAGVTSQAILQGDEYDEASGVISKPAAILANWSQYLTRIPIIGRFATATNIGATAVSRIASLFGWSNVPVISSVMPFKNLPFHDLASAEISQPVTKFTLDPKAEQSVSPYMVGLNGEDELAVASFAQRNSYLTSFTWNTTDTADTLFFSSVVNPLLYDRGTADANGTLSIMMVPMALVARMFRYWRGDMIFTFRIIASPFHRGRMRLHWEPYSTPSTTTDTSHANMTKIVDIESSTDVEFRIPYLQPIPWCEQMHQGDIYTTNRWSTTAVKTPSKGDDNGALVVRCLNNLSAPVDTAPVTVMVFVRGAENMQFANPIDIGKRFSYVIPQSADDFEYKTDVDEHLYIKNWGEPILSLRSLMRRAQLVDIVPAFLSSDPTTFIQEMRYPMTKYPPPPGYNNNSYNSARNLAGTGPAGFYFTNMTAFSWIAPCFLALRGSMRWHFNIINHQNHGPASVSVYRDPGVVMSAPGVYAIVPSTGNTDNLYVLNSWNNLSNWGASGLALTNYETQTGLSVEMPYMIPYKFYINAFSTWGVGSSTDKSNADTYKLIVRTNDNTTNQDMGIERYCSIGTDFNAHFFLCVPQLFYNAAAGQVTP